MIEVLRYILRLRKSITGAVMVVAFVVSSVGLEPVWASDTGAQQGSAIDKGSGVSDVVDLGGGLSATIDPRTGGLRVTFGGVLGVAWESAAAVAGVDTYGFGKGTGVSVSRVDTSGGVTRVFPPAGGVYEADGGEPSGLARYKGEDVSFSPVGGVLPAREGVDQVQVFESSLETLGGQTQYFNGQGGVVATTDGYRNRVDVVWENGEVVEVVGEDGVSARVDSKTTPGVVAVEGAPRWDGVVTRVEFGVEDGYLTHVKDPAAGANRVGGSGFSTPLSHHRTCGPRIRRFVRVSYSVPTLCERIRVLVGTSIG